MSKVVSISLDAAAYGALVGEVGHRTLVDNITGKRREGPTEVLREAIGFSWLTITGKRFGCTVVRRRQEPMEELWDCPGVPGGVGLRRDWEPLRYADGRTTRLIEESVIDFAIVPAAATVPAP